MTLQEQIDKLQQTVRAIAAVQQESLDVLGMTVESQRRIAARQASLDMTMKEIGDKLNALIAVVDV